MDWTLQEVCLQGQEISDLWTIKDSKRLVRRVTSKHNVLILGSSQSRESVDLNQCAKWRVDVINRRTGGGSIFLTPTNLLWVDFIITRGDVLWDDDIHRSSLWVANTWKVALEALISTPLTIASQVSQKSDLEKSFCFAGTSIGELVFESRKLVGISQRRTRDKCIFSTGIYVTYDTDLHSRLFLLSRDQRIEASNHLRSSMVTLSELYKNSQAQIDETGKPDAAKLHDLVWNHLTRVLPNI